MVNASKYKNTLLILFEIIITTIVFYGFRKFINHNSSLFPDNLFLGVIILLTVLALLFSILLYIFIKVNRLITKETFNYRNAFLLLILGIIFSSVFIFFVTTNMILKEGYFPEFVVIFCSIAIPILFFNYGLRIKNNYI